MTIRDEIKEIDSRSWKIVKLMEDRVRPLARISNNILAELGEMKRISLFRSRKQFKAGKLTIRRCRSITRDVQVFFEDELVFEFDSMLYWSKKYELEDKKYLFVYKSGPWEQQLVTEYRRMRMIELEVNYGVDGETCALFDHDNGECGKGNAECPCPEFVKDEEQDEVSE